MYIMDKIKKQITVQLLNIKYRRGWNVQQDTLILKNI